MYCETCSEPIEVQDVVRKHNRMLRRIVSNLRRSVQRSAVSADTLFAALCETDPAAELAMRELWESGHYTCGPQDYDEIVKQTIEAMKLTKMKFEQSAQAQSQQPCNILFETGAYGWSCTRENGHSGQCAAVHD